METPLYHDLTAPHLREIKPFTRPMVSYTLIALTVLVYLGQMAGQSLLGVDILAVYGSKVNSAIIHGEYWRLLTPVFLHGSPLHIGFNMYALYVLGPNLERFYGRWQFILLYLLAGISGNMSSFIFSPHPSLGSSTAIFGLLGAYGVFIYHNRVLFGSMARSSLTNIILVAVVNFIIGLAPGIDNWGHLGGILGGTAFAIMSGPRIMRLGLPPHVRLFDKRPAVDAIRAAAIISVLLIAILLTQL
ncbi:MAG: rhomboid family intramembrane serine protease [Chloroflexi bacterium]|nr:rhomboid family intramembrane serine protease [Chloroflexota bacterium]